jgi:ParB family transcriptional regulator, chromosome partitioning protein
MSLRDRISQRMTISLNSEDEAAAATMKSTGPTTGPGQTMQIAALRQQLNEAKAELAKRGDGKAEARIRELEEQLASASCLEIPLDRIHEVPGRRRFMPADKYTELRENLRQNRLITPITVQVRSDGDYEIVSGHHRTDAYRELGRQTIRGVIGEGTSVEAEDGAFFANLMQSDLTDYEKYIGLKRLHSRHAKLSQAELGSRVGISASQVNALLAFDRLPAEALEVVEENKAIMGARAASELATVTEAGKSERVIEAVRKLAAKELDQAQAVKFARSVPAGKKAKPAGASYKVKTGKSTWCDVRMTKNIMRIEFTSEQVAEGVQEAIKSYLETLASKT